MSSTLETCEIHESWFTLSSSHTCYANERKLEALPTKKEALDLYKSVVSTVKSLGGKVSYRNKTKASINALADQALGEHTLYNSRYESLKAHWIKTIPGISTGEKIPFDQSEESFSKGYEMRNEMMEMLYRNTALSQYRSICNHLSEIKTSLDGKSEYHGKIVL